MLQCMGLQGVRHEWTTQQYQWLCSVVLVSVVEQSESAVYVLTSLRFWISFPFRSLQSIESSPSYRFSLVICSMWACPDASDLSDSLRPYGL